MRWRKKRWSCIFICVTLLIIIAIRIWAVNASAFSFSEEVYQVGEWVPLDGDFFYSKSEGTKDYYVRVSSAEVLSYKSFMSRFNKKEDYLASKSQHDVIMLRIDFRNDGDIQGGVFIRDSNLLNQFQSSIYNKDDEYMKIANDTYAPDMFGVSVKPHTTSSMNYVYTTVERTDGVSYLEEMSAKENIKMYLIVSLYPTRKVIEIDLDLTEYKNTYI